MDEQKLKAVAERVLKLLALANSPNENEASMAAQKAHELLLRYNLDLQKLQERAPSQYEQLTVDQRTFRKTEDDFVDRIITEHFFVLVYTMRKRGPLYMKNRSVPTWYESHTIIEGTKENVQIAAYVRAFLVAKFYQLWLDHKRTMLMEPREQRPYYLGLEHGLNRKLRESKKRVETEYSLVIVSDPYLVKRSNSMSNRSSRGVEYTDSYSAGKTDGQKIEIRRGLTGETGESGKLLGPGKKKE